MFKRVTVRHKRIKHAAVKLHKHNPKIYKLLSFLNKHIVYDIINILNKIEGILFHILFSFNYYYFLFLDISHLI